MKNVLRNWLGIEALEKKVGEVVLPSKAELKKMIGPAIEAAMNDSEEWDLYFCGVSFKLKSRVRDLIEDEVARIAKDQLNELAAKRVEGEAFIDDVVERIKRKQVSWN